MTWRGFGNPTVPPWIALDMGGGARVDVPVLVHERAPRLGLHPMHFDRWQRVRVMQLVRLAIRRHSTKIPCDPWGFAYIRRVVDELLLDFAQREGIERILRNAEPGTP